MSLKRINYILFALLIVCLIINFVLTSSQYLLGTKILIYFPTFALIIAVLVILMYQKQLLILQTRTKIEMVPNREEISEKTSMYNYLVHVLNNSSESIVILNQNREVIYHNNSAVTFFGISKDKIYTDDIILRESPFEKSQLIAIKQSLKSGQIWQGEQNLYVNGEARTHLHKVIPLGEKETIKGAAVYSLDISELIQTRKDAESANMVKNQFLANISHELRTPLIGILGAVELLERSTVEYVDTENTKIIRECGERLLEIINNILDVSRIGLGLASCHPVDCNVNNLINNTVNIIHPALQEKGLTIDLQIDSELPNYLSVDQDKLQQILLNILYNAVKFTTKGGIVLKLDYSNGISSSWLTISIMDTGIGIPEDQLCTIFSPFTQVDSSSSREYEGTGLGLYICKELVDLMNGEMWIKSEKNQGSTFYLKLPVADTINKALPDKENKNITLDPVDDLFLGFSAVRILVVDDNELTQKIVCQILNNYGFETEVASNGVSGFNLLQRCYCDLVLMDMQMPLMDGYETTRMIRSHSQLASIPIIAMTANSTADAREKCQDCGCSAYIAKPFKAEELINIINNCLKDTSSSSDDAASENDLIAALIPEFLDSLCESIDELDEAVKNNNIQDVRSISHDIKGSAGLYGFHEISHTAAEIEQAARKNEQNRITSSFSQLRNLYKNIGA